MPPESTASTEARNIYRGFIQFEERSAALYLELSVRFFDNTEVSWFWVEMAMEEKQHAGMLQHCSEAGVFACKLPGKDQIQRLNALEARVQDSALTLDDAFEMAIALESSEINDVYSRLTAPIEGPAHIMQKMFVSSAYPKAGDTEATTSRTTRIERVSIPRDST